jgi:SAM-dependent methyltransferase
MNIGSVVREFVPPIALMGNGRIARRLRWIWFDRVEGGATGISHKLRRLLWEASLFGLAREDANFTVTRYSMYRRLQEIAPILPIREGRVLSISHSRTLIDVLGIDAHEVTEASYPESNILALPFKDAAFDFVLSDQVLEHVEGDPQLAINECHRVLRYGGIACHTTCFINPIHGAPNDFWRFTPNALRLLHKNYSRILECGGWGNFHVWHAIRDNVRYVPIPRARWHPLRRLAIKNDPEWPLHVWIVTQK